MTRRVLVGIVLGLGLLLVVDAIAVRLGLAAGLIPRPQDALAWTTSRAAGITAFVALTLDVLFGLFVSTRAIDHLIPRARTAEVHRWLSTVTLALVALHCLALLGDRIVRFDLLDALVPFLSTYRPLAIGMGILAAYAAIIVHASFELRRHIGPKNWRRLHFLSFFVFVAAAGHGIFAGSDSNEIEMQMLYAAAVTAVGALGLYRVAAARGPSPKHPDSKASGR